MSAFSPAVRIVSVPRQDAFASHGARQRMMGDTLAGLGARQDDDHLVFVLAGSGEDCRVALAVADGVGHAAPADSLRAVLSANFPGISLVDEDMDHLLDSRLVASAALIGSPSPSWPEAPDDPGPLDRLIAGGTLVHQSAAYSEGGRSATGNPNHRPAVTADLKGHPFGRR